MHALIDAISQVKVLFKEMNLVHYFPEFPPSGTCSSSRPMFSLPSIPVLLSCKHVYTIHFHLRSEQVAVDSEISDQLYSLSGGNATYVQRSIPPYRPTYSQVPPSLSQGELMIYYARLRGDNHCIK